MRVKAANVVHLAVVEHSLSRFRFFRIAADGAIAAMNALRRDSMSRTVRGAFSGRRAANGPARHARVSRFVFRVQSPIKVAAASCFVDVGIFRVAIANTRSGQAPDRSSARRGAGRVSVSAAAARRSRRIVGRTFIRSVSSRQFVLFDCVVLVSFGSHWLISWRS